MLCEDLDDFGILDDFSDFWMISDSFDFSTFQPVQAEELGVRHIVFKSIHKSSCSGIG
jgi:hypothetical protein